MKNLWKMIAKNKMINFPTYNTLPLWITIIKYVLKFWRILNINYFTLNWYGIKCEENGKHKKCLSGLRIKKQTTNCDSTVNVLIIFFLFISKK